MKFIQKLTLGSLWALGSLLITASIVLGSMYFYMYIRLPSVAMLKDIHMQEPLRVFSSDGKFIAEYGEKRRIPVKLKDIPTPLINAVLATEDRRYYEHPGIDLIGLIRAAKAILTTGRKTQGASTITMQVARNFFLSRKKTYTRKINEILLALKIDHTLSKDKVLELYFNKVYLGNRAYGMAAAAKTYYGKTLDELNLAQMAMLAGLPRSPSRDNPIRNPSTALERRNHVLARMLEAKMITLKEYEETIKAPVTAEYHPLTPELHAPYVGEMVRQAMVDEYGEDAYTRGFDVYTTIDSKLQNYANASLDKGLMQYDRRHGGYRRPTKNLGPPTLQNIAKWPEEIYQIAPAANLQPAVVLRASSSGIEAILKNKEHITIPPKGFTWTHGHLPQPGDVIRVIDSINKNKEGVEDRYWKLSQIPEIQGALVALDPNSGAILALKGGFAFHVSHYNRATQSERQPGSSFKPFIYSAALAKGFTLASVINDSPIVIGNYGDYDYWRPQNNSRQFYGPTRLRVGLVRSRNIVTVRLLQQIGVQYALHYLTRFGFNRQQMPTTLSLSLGAGSFTPLQMATAYAVFANGGYKVSPYFIQAVFEADHPIYKADPPIACHACPPGTHNVAPRVISADNAYLISDVLKGVIQHGTGRRALVLKRMDIAGKTGTTNDKKDAWFSGFNRDIVTTVWVGYDTPKSIQEYGSQAALPIWIDFMDDALKNKPENIMPQPENIVMVRIDRHTGLLAYPGQKDAILEMFREQYAPTDSVSGDNQESELYGDAHHHHPQAEDSSIFYDIYDDNLF